MLRTSRTRRADYAALAVGIGRNQARIDSEALAVDQALVNAAAHDGLEALAQQIALAQAAESLNW